MTKDEALTLEAYVEGYRSGFDNGHALGFTEGSDMTLTQPAQEPVAWSWVPSEDWGSYFTEDASKAAVMRERGLEVRPLYTTPPQRTWVGLTDEEIEDCVEMSIQKTCRAIEQALKEKNT
jgi:hypothetical protein